MQCRAATQSSTETRLSCPRCLGIWSCIARFERHRHSGCGGHPHEFHMKFMRHLSAPGGQSGSTGTTPAVIPQDRTTRHSQAHAKPVSFASGGVECGAPRCGETLFTEMLQATVLPAPRRVSSDWIGDMGSTVNPISMTLEAKI